MKVALILMVALAVVISCRSAAGNSHVPSSDVASTGSPPSPEATMAAQPANSVESTSSASRAPAPTDSPCGPASIGAVEPDAADAPDWGGPFIQPPVRAGDASTVDEIRERGFDLKVPEDVALRMHLVFSDRNTKGIIFEVRQYFSADEVPSNMKLDDLLQGGGMFLSQRLTIGNDAETVLAEVKDARLVEVGPVKAALVWGSPRREGGRRTYNLYWSDGIYDFSLRSGFETPEQAVNIARSMYC